MVDGFCDNSPDEDDFGTTAPPAPPGNDLAIFDGQPADGNWQLFIQNFSPEPGNLQVFELHIQYGTGPSGNFSRGDCNNDGLKDIADPVRLLSFLFPVLPPPVPVECDNACDANDDETLNIADAVQMLQTLFPSGPPPGWLPPDACGPDPTPSTLGCGFSTCP